MTPECAQSEARRGDEGVILNRLSNPYAPPHDEDLHELIAERYERSSALVTSNLDIDEWGDVFPGNRVLGQATIDLLRHAAYKLVLDGASNRTPQTDDSGPKPVLAKTAKNTAS